MGLDGGAWTHTCPMLLAMMVAEQVGVGMMKEYFKIEASKSVPQYGFRKGLKLSGDEGYQAAKNNLEVTLLRRECIDMLLWKNLCEISESKYFGTSCSLKENEVGR